MKNHSLISLVFISVILTGCLSNVGTSYSEPEFLTSPMSATVQEGREASFFVQVSGNPLPEISWEKSSDGIAWTKIDHAAGGKYSFIAQTADNLSSFRAKAGRAISESATLTVVSSSIVNQITQFGITWTFDKAYQTGQFANGDYWVVGPVTIIDINPNSTTDASGRIKNGSEINPGPYNTTDIYTNFKQGYDSELWSNYTDTAYDSSLNKAFNVRSGGSTLVVSTNNSLVSTISRDQVGRPQLKTCAILTVLASPPSVGSFRPPYVGTDKAVKFNKSQLNYTLLKNHIMTPAILQSMTTDYWVSHPVYADLTMTVTDPATAMLAIERMFERPRLDYVHEEPGRFIHPVDNMYDFGREIAIEISIGAIMLNMQFTDAEKENLLIKYVQQGIDTYGIIENGGEQIFHIAGGHCAGRKWLILFAGLVLNDTDMKNIGYRSDVNFAEDDMTFYVTKHPNPASVWSFNGTYWISDGTDEKYDIFVPNPNPALDPNFSSVPPSFNSAGYRPHAIAGTYVVYGHGNTNKEVDYLEYGDKHEGLPDWKLDSYSSGLDWSSVYRDCGNGEVYGGYALAANMIPGARALWNHEAFFDYTDRFCEIWPTIPAQVPREQASTFVSAIWREYRNLYKPVWTRNDPTDIYSNGNRI